MHPTTFAQTSPEKPALLDADTGKSLSYRQLNERANQAAHALRHLGLKRGDVVAVLLENGFDIFDIAWAAQRSGLYLTSISTKFSASDVGYIVDWTRAPACSLPRTDCPRLQRRRSIICLRYEDSRRHRRSAASKAGQLFAIASLRRELPTRVRAPTCCIPREPRVGPRAFALLFQAEVLQPRHR